MKDQRLTTEATTGERIRDHRLSLALSQQMLAAAMTQLGFSWRQTTVAKTEAAERPIRVNELAALAEIFGVGIAQLVDDSPESRRGTALRESLRANTKQHELNRQIDSIRGQEEQLRGRLNQVRDQRLQYETQLGELQTKRKDLEAERADWAKKRAEHQQEYVRLTEEGEADGRSAKG